MPSIKEYNRKLKSLVNTRKITKTMKMVAASKLRKAYESQLHAKLHAQNFTALISRISASVESTASILLNERPHVKNALVVLFTSDTGLCGSFNNNAMMGAMRWIEENRPRFEKIDMSFCGRKGFMFFQKKEPVKTYYENVTATPRFSNAKRIGNELCQSFISGEYDEVYLIFNQFFNPLSQRMIVEKILPIDPQALMHDTHFHEKTDYLFEPHVAELLEYLIPHFIYFKIYFSLLENSAGEHGARMSAMDNATKNATEIINRTNLLRNRARQAEITIELAEIIGGAEALK